ncbi:MAG TPA: AI-2E family transporter [Puia sp.]|nr:AI-2E family transporter [Puia sp.]
MNSIKLAFYARVALILHGIALMLLFMYLGKSICIPLFFAFLIAILLHPFVIWLEKLHVPRAMAAIIAVLIFLAFIGGLIYFFSHQVIRFSKDLPHLQQRISTKLQGVQDWVSDRYNIDDSAQINYVTKSANGFTNAAVNSIATTFVGMIRVVVLSIFFFIFTFFILFHRRLLMRFLLALFNSRHSHRVQAIVLEVNNVMKNYVLGLLTEMLILIIMIFISLSIMGIKYALLMAVTAGILNIIPYLGIYSAMFISMLITLANGTAPQVLGIGIVFIAAHFVDANIILPRIVGGRVKLNPLITIIAVLIGNLLWGIPGMFLFIPLTAIFRIISEEIEDLKPWSILIGEEKN